MTEITRKDINSMRPEAAVNAIKTPERRGALVIKFGEDDLVDDSRGDAVAGTDLDGNDLKVLGYQPL